MNIALFDFDGTITNEDTYTKFIFYSTSKVRLAIGLLLVFPVIFLYKMGLLSAARTRPILTKVAFWNRNKEKVMKVAKEYASLYLPSVIRDNAMERIIWHKNQGDMVFVVSASLDVYLSFWCEMHGLKLICSELESENNKYTGNYVSGDCCGENKVKFIKNNVDISKYSSVFAYGDTEEDLPMLEMAHIKYYQWSEVINPA
ncbi:HAD family hydrolase [Colwelliaceae bacterium 6441]